MKIAIRGHVSKGHEVIQILESLGGKNRNGLIGDSCLGYYLIVNNNIELFKNTIWIENTKLYTLEEFKKEFPFKIGDTVLLKGVNQPYKIAALELHMDKLWYKLDSGLHCRSESLMTYKEMKEERNITLTLEKAKEWYKKGGELKKVALQAYSEEELTKVDLPKTWEEFCEKYPVKNGECWLKSEDQICSATVTQDRKYRNWIPSKKSAEAHLAMIQLEQLRDCWRQGWKPTKCDTGYCITHYPGEYLIMAFSFISFLSFPTKEIAIQFLDCFKDLIEKAGDLI